MVGRSKYNTTLPKVDTHSKVMSIHEHYGVGSPEISDSQLKFGGPKMGKTDKLHYELEKELTLRESGLRTQLSGLGLSDKMRAKSIEKAEEVGESPTPKKESKSRVFSQSRAPPDASDKIMNAVSKDSLRQKGSAGRMHGGFSSKLR